MLAYNPLTMEYFVIGQDGQQYGPANMQTLETWAAENRLAPSTILKDTVNGQTLPASSVLRAFSAPAPAPAPAAAHATPPPGYQPTGFQNPPAQNPNAPYARPSQNWSNPPGYAPAPRRNDGDWGIVANVVVRAVLAVVFFFFLHGIGLIFGAYALIYAIKAKSDGHRHGALMIGIAAVALAAVVAGRILRVGGTGRAF